MPTIFDPQERQALLRRFDTLDPARPPRWGRMNAQQMLCHLKAAFEIDFEAPPPAHISGPATHFPINWLVIHVLPWPKGILPSPKEFLDFHPTTWEVDLAAVKSLIEKAAAHGPEGSWPMTPAFGKISGKSWGALIRKHADHHLRQFGA
jgi:hypothetical protein